MSRIAVVIAAVASIAACSGPVLERSALPSNGRQFDPGRVLFRFAILSDRTGGARPGIFEAAVGVVNDLQPDFVMSVGDLIEGYSDERDVIDAQWEAFEARVAALEMPFFYVPGNHDLNSPASVAAWEERRGPAYYAFLHEEHLFVVLSSEDPAMPLSDEQRAALLAAARRDPAEFEALEHEQVVPAFSAEQLDWLEQVLVEHPDVRWTFVFAHKPFWQWDRPDVKRLEQLLAGRPRTVFAGHAHNYQRSTVDGAEYLRLGTSGAAVLPWRPLEGNLDHLTWVSALRAGPPVIANVELSGVYDSSGRRAKNRPFVPERRFQPPEAAAAPAGRAPGVARGDAGRAED